MQNEWKDEAKGQQEVTYRWDYGAQVAFDAAQKGKQKRRGVLIYAVVMTLFFALCFAALAVTVIRYGDALERPSYGAGLSTVEVAERVKPSTVLIYASKSTSYGYGTGFFIRENGYIATNAHVVDGATHLTVTLYTGEKLEAELIGASVADDLAVLKIEGNGYPVAKIGDSDALRVGETAIAVGNPSGDRAPWSTTQGIISALDREVTVEGSSSIEELTMIQTDAPVNPGNSGGPLCNDRGQVIGVVTRKLSDYESIGLAIPINGAMEILNAIVETGSADGIQSSVSKKRPTIGISGGTIKKGDQYSLGGVVYRAEKDGVIVSTVDPNGAAADVIKVADIIIEFDGKPISDMDVLIEQLYSHKIGDKVSITVWRNGEAVEVSVVLGVGN
jgi:serine protease Do